MSNVLKSKGFKYIKNLLIGVGAAVVLIGALFKIMSWAYADELLIVGMLTEAGLFFFLGVIGPEKDYYWEKLYPGLDDYAGVVNPITQAGQVAQQPPVSKEMVEKYLGSMIGELQVISGSLSSLKALQEVDFSGTKEQLRTMTNFYTKINDAMMDLQDSTEETKAYKVKLAELNKNLGDLNRTYTALNQVYGNMLSAMANVRQNG
ncbi:MAG: gliding motility protein GldL [Bacteroidota bacterium]